MRHRILSFVVLFCIGCQVVPLQTSQPQQSSTDQKTVNITPEQRYQSAAPFSNPQPIKKYEITRELKTSQGRAELVMTIVPFEDILVHSFSIGSGQFEEGSQELSVFYKEANVLSDLVWSVEKFENNITYTGRKPDFHTKGGMGYTTPITYLALRNLDSKEAVHINIQKNKTYTFRFILPDCTDLPYKRLLLLNIFYFGQYG